MISRSALKIISATKQAIDAHIDGEQANGKKIQHRGTMHAGEALHDPFA